MVEFSIIGAHVEAFVFNKTHLVRIRLRDRLRVRIGVRERMRDANLQPAFLDVARWQTRQVWGPGGYVPAFSE